MKRSGKRSRELVAQETARLMLEGGIESIPKARAKALRRFGLPGHGPAVPTEAEVRRELEIRVRLFARGNHQQAWQRWCLAALEVMELLTPFAAVAGGAVATGLLLPAARLVLYTTAATPEDLAHHLLDRGVRFTFGDLRIPCGSGECTVNAYRLRGQHHETWVAVLPQTQWRRSTPLSRDGSTLPHMDRETLLAALDQPHPEQGE
jgi:hypothetical protein